MDSKSEMPMALEVTPAHVNDGDMATTLMEQVITRTKDKFFMSDPRIFETTTELYGKTISFNATISGHTTADTQFCSNCYGAGDPIAGSHALKKLP